MIWLIGNRGMLGSDVEELLSYGNMDFIVTDIDVDITDYRALNSFASERKIDWIINCAAYTAVDRAEDEPEKAFMVNADGPKNIAKIAFDKGAKLIHISTDYVFDGKKDATYTEDDVPDPLCVYGKSKLAGERNIQSLTDTYFIVRTEWLYGKNGNNFVHTMLKLFDERDTVSVVEDQWGSPTYSKDLANAIFRIVKKESVGYGIYHFTNEGKTNWYGFAKEIYERARERGLLNRECSLVPIKTQEYPTKAVRPKNSCLSKDKIKTVFELEIRDWKNALMDFIDEIQKN